ncbi:MAG: tetratricopeptide repeat protein [Rubripirellula sp.]
MRRLNRRVFAITLIVLAVLSASVFGIHRFQVSRQSDFYFDQGEEARLTGSFAEAATSYRKALETEPRRTAALRGLSECLEEVGNLRGAYLTALRVVSAEEFAQDDIFRLARLSLSMKRYTDASEHLQTLLKDETDEVKIYRNLLLLGEAYSGNLDSQSAEEAYRKAAELAVATPEAYNRLANLQSGQRQSTDSAKQTLDTMIERFESNPDAWIARGTWYLENSESRHFQGTAIDSAAVPRTATSSSEGLARAAADARQALDLDQDSLQALALATRVAIAQSDYPQAEEWAAQGRTRFPEERTFYVYAANSLMARAEQTTDEQEKSNLLLESQRILQAGMRKLPQEASLVWALANQYLTNGNAEPIPPLIARLKQLRFTPALVRYLDAKRLSVEGHNLDAARQLELVRADVVEVPTVVRLVDLSLADLYRDIGDIDRQIAVLRRVVNSDGSWLPGRERLAIALLQAGRVDEAVEEYKNFAARPGLPITAPLNFARLLILQNLNRVQANQDWTAVVKILNQLDREESLRSDVAVLRAEMYAGRNMLSQARETLREATDSLDAKDAQNAWAARILLEVSAGDGARASNLVDEATELLGDTPGLRYAQAMSILSSDQTVSPSQLQELSQPSNYWTPAETLAFRRQMVPLMLSTKAFDISLTLIEEILGDNPNDVAARLQKLQVTSQRGDLDAMRDTLDRLESLSGRSAVWHYGHALLLQGEHTKGTSNPRSATPVMPGSDQPTQNQRLSDDMNREAQDHLAEAAVLRPEWSYVPALAGNLHYLAEDEESAILRYLQAVDLGFRQPALLRRLINLLTERERFGEADSLIRRLRDGNRPFSPEMARIASEISAQLADLQQATRLASEAAEKSGTVNDWLWLANLRELNDQPADAEAAYKIALGTAPKSPTVQLAYIGFLNRQSRLGEAKKALVNYSKQVAPSDQLGQLVIAEGLWRIGDSEAAQTQLKQIRFDQLESVEQFQTSYELMLNLGDTDAAQTLASSLVERNDDVGYWARRVLALRLASLPHQELDVPKARSLIVRNLSRFFRNADIENTSFKFSSTDPNTYLDRRAFAVVLAVTGGNAGAERPLGIFQQLIDDGWSANIPDQFLIGQLFAITGDWSRGRRLMLPLLGRTEQSDSIHVQTYASLLIDRGDAAEARLWINRLVDSGDSSLKTVRLVAEVMFRLGEHRSLVQALTASPKDVAPNDDSEIAWVVQTASSMERFKLLSEFATRARELENDSSTYGIYETAETDIGQQLVKSDAFPGMLFAQQILLRGDFERALQAFENASPNATTDELVAFADAVVRSPGCDPAVLGRIERAFAELTIEETDDNVLEVVQARIKEMRGDTDGAALIYRRILQSHPSDMVALNNLATVLALSETDPTEGIRLCDKAMEHHGTTFVLLDTRGVSRLMAGDLDGAESDFDAAFDLFAHPVIQFHRSWVAHQKGDGELASRLFLLAKGNGLRAADLHPMELKYYKAVEQRLAAPS